MSVYKNKEQKLETQKSIGRKGMSKVTCRPLVIESPKYKVVIDKNQGCILELVNRIHGENWVASGERFHFGQPFVRGTQWDEQFISCKLQEYDNRKAHFISRSGLTNIDYTFKDEVIECSITVPDMRGPRSGIELDFNFLDLPTRTHWTAQVVPITIYTGPDLRYAYFILARPQGDYMVLAVSSSFTGWRLKYSYAGHRILGMQLLTRVDDIIILKGGKLPDVCTLSFQMKFARSLKNAYEYISSMIGLALAVFDISGGPEGAGVPLRIIGEATQVRVYTPEGKVFNLGYKGNGEKIVVHLKEPGVYKVQTTSKGNQQHITRLLCHASWSRLFSQINDFYRKYVQRPEGSFARVIWRDTLSPEGGRTFEGVAFGDTFEEASCRSGEFGGFAAWAMIKNLLLFGPNPHLEESVRRYIKDWAWQEGALPNNPYPGAIYLKPQQFLGRNYGSYHLYHEVNYPQHEEFFIEEFLDYYKLTKEPKALEFAVKLADHMLKEHRDKEGAIICQNSLDSLPVDYSTVHTPGPVFIKLGNSLKELGRRKEASKFFEAARALSEHLLKRGPEFPTEGEQCTEEGSMACTAITLLFSYYYLDPKPEWLTLGKKILKLHEALVMHAPDCRIYGSSFRFWETQYETADWGPSINAGHAWSIWTSEAKVLLYLITSEIRWLREAYCAFIANIAKVTPSGGMPCCYIPDMIPGTPHAPWQSGEPDAVMTTSLLASDYPRKTFSTSGNYFLIRAAEIWDHISGLDVINEEVVCINGILRDGTFISSAPYFNRLALGRAVDGLKINVQNTDILTVTIEKGSRGIEIKGGEIIKSDEHQLVIKIETSFITFCVHEDSF